MKLTDFPRHVQEQIVRDNPSLFAGGLETKVAKPTTPRALGRREAEQGCGATGLAIRVEFTACLRRELDDDNLVASIKPLRDSVARTIGLDDGDKRITWTYAQTKSNRPCVLVRIIAQSQ